PDLVEGARRVRLRHDVVDGLALNLERDGDRGWLGRVVPGADQRSGEVGARRGAGVAHRHLADDLDARDAGVAGEGGLRGGEQQGRGGERLPRMAWRGDLVHGNSWE